MQSYIVAGGIRLNCQVHKPPTRVWSCVHARCIRHACATIERVSMGDIAQVPVTELPDDFTGDDTRILLDVREDDEWAAGHVKGAVHIPLGDVPARLDEIDLDADLLVICHSSGRSMRVLNYLAQMGFDGSCVRGGMLAWLENGKPVEVGESAG